MNFNINYKYFPTSLWNDWSNNQRQVGIDMG